MSCKSKQIFDGKVRYLQKYGKIYTVRIFFITTKKNY